MQVIFRYLVSHSKFWGESTADFISAERDFSDLGVEGRKRETEGGRDEGGRGDLDACGESAITDWAVQLGRILLTARRDSELGFTALSEMLPFLEFIFISPVSQPVLPSANLPEFDTSCQNITQHEGRDSPLATFAISRGIR